VGGDFNARTGQHRIRDIVGTNGENILNENVKLLRNLITFNKK
jgi:hypothetical protein